MGQSERHMDLKSFSLRNLNLYYKTCNMPGLTWKDNELVIVPAIAKENLPNVA